MTSSDRYQLLKNRMDVAQKLTSMILGPAQKGKYQGKTALKQHDDACS